MDLGSWSRQELQTFCREQNLYAGGSTAELEERIQDALAPGTWVDVYFVARECFRRGYVSRLLYDNKFEVIYEDNGKSAIHKLGEDLFTIVPTTDEESEEEEVEILDVQEWSRQELKDFLRDCGLYTGGSTVDLQDRVRDVLANSAVAVESEQQSGWTEDITAGMAGLNTHDSPYNSSHRGPKKRALIVGCSYKGTSSHLRGTLNDASDIHSLLIDHFKFPNTTEHIMLLTDDHTDRYRLPTRRNILKGFEWLMQDLQAGDSLFFYFAGHGSSVPDPTGEEPNGYNQAICSCDYSEAGTISDTVIHKMLVAPLPMGVTLHSLIDSCHSGTVMNLPYNALLKRGVVTNWGEEY